MQIKLFEFNRHRETVEAFEARVRAFVASAPSVTKCEVTALTNPDMLIALTLSEEPSRGQDFCLFTGLDLDEIEELANNTLEALSRIAKIATHVSVLPLKSPRAVLAMIVQQRRNESNGSNGEEGAGQEAAREPDKAADAVSDSGAERPKRGRDRKTPKNGA